MSAIASPALPHRPTRVLAALAALLLALPAVAVLAGPRADVTAATAGSTTTGPRVALDPAVPDALATTDRVEVIVRVTPASLPAARAAVTDHGGAVLHDLPIVDSIVAEIGAAALDALMAIPGVIGITHDGPVELAHTPPLGEESGDSFFPQTVNADSLYRAGIDGTGVGIAVVDTGVSEVSDLAGRLVGKWDFTPEQDHVDHYGHGTFIAGIAAGDGAASRGKHAGVAPGAHVVPVKIAGRDGASDISHVLAAIQYVVSFKDAYDIGVLNLSLGTDSTQPNALSPLNYAVERAWDAGIVVVVSAGNWGEKGPGHIPKPADDPLVITVGATDSEGTRNTGDDTVAAYSSRGPSIADQIDKPDLVAPGSHIIAAKSPGSTVDLDHPEAHIKSDYMRGSGTSFAAAVVSGSAALLRQAHPDWTPDQIKGALLSTAAPGPVGDRNVDGHGIVDVAAAAALTDPAPANQDVSRSTGLGTLGATRGGLSVSVTLDSGLEVCLDLSTDLTAQNLLFDPVTYTTSDWTSSAWYSSAWYSSAWYSSAWYSSAWYSSAWYSSAWYSSAWY